LLQLLFPFSEHFIALDTCSSAVLVLCYLFHEVYKHIFDAWLYLFNVNVGVFHCLKIAFKFLLIGGVRTAGQMYKLSEGKCRFSFFIFPEVKDKPVSVICRYLV